MKKVLLGTSALVAAGMMASTPVLAAEKISVRVGGYMEQWFGYSSVDDRAGRDLDGFNHTSDSEIHFVGSTTLDNGIEFGVNVQLEANSNSGDQIDESYLYAQGSFGEINLGDENSAMYKMHYSPTDYGITLNTGDQGDWAGLSGSGLTSAGFFRGTLGSTYVEPQQANDTAKLTYYTPRFGGFQFGASYAPDDRQDNNDLADRDTRLTDMVTFGANYKGEFGGFSVGVSGGYGTYLSAPNGSNEPEAWNAGLVVGFGGFQLGGSYADSSETNNGTDGEAYNVGVSYTTGPLGVSLNYFNGEVKGNIGSGGTVAQTEQDTFHLAANYTLGPGVVASATLGHAMFESDDVAGEQEATYLVTGIKLSF
ncbi:MAG TPA: porin [Thalassobaculum sp.]